MKNFYIPIVIALGILWAIGLFFGFIKGVQKGFLTQPSQTTTLDSENLKKQQSQRAQDIELQRKILMEDLKEKARDAQR